MENVEQSKTIQGMFKRKAGKGGIDSSSKPISKRDFK